jgi:hypothetical protein
VACLDAERGRAKQERAERAAGYDRERERQGWPFSVRWRYWPSKTRERDQAASRNLYPAMEDERRQEKLAKLDLDIKAAVRMADALTLVAGDVEAVCDEHRWLPSERRVLAPRSLVSSGRRGLAVRDGLFCPRRSIASPQR